ncbi:MAG: maleylpyruvate isomerase family mycothiol-dependent enzyme [Streptosporangiaceae bacterium]
MEYSRFLDCLAADFTRLRAVAPIDLDAAVPSCPGWTVSDLARHVGEVYVHKTLAMREGAEPGQWPPEGLAQEEPLALLDRAYAGLLSEFAARQPEDPAGTWYTPDQTVGFWIRRMAQETVIHRIDAELGTGVPVAPVPDDLAVDGIDELLKVFTAFGVAEWGSYFTDILGGSPGWTYAVRAGGAAWRVRTGPGLFVVEDRAGQDGPGDGAGDGPADVTAAGPPAAVLRWVWNRENAGEPGGVTVEGAPDAVEELRRCIVMATQ